MESTLSLPFWWRFFATLAAELALMFGLGCAAQILFRTAIWRRTVWQVCIVGSLALLIVELTGAAHLLTTWARGANRSPVTDAFALTERSITITVTQLPVPSVSSGATFPPPVAELVPSQNLWSAILWLGGFALFAAWSLAVRAVWTVIALRKRRPADPRHATRVQELARRLGLRRRVRVLEIGGLRVPIAFGLLRPTIGLPPRFADDFSEPHRDAILVHELAHLAARDSFWHGLADFVAATLWWHPLIWSARRRLHAATEAAADEATLLLEDGPSTLAESLVRFGRLFPARRRLGALGVDGNGFRSGLGQRVERLLHLSGRQWRAPSRLHSCLMKTAGPLFFAGAALLARAWAVPHQPEPAPSINQWHQSIAGRAVTALSRNFAPPAESAAPDTDTHPTNAAADQGKVIQEKVAEQNAAETTGSRLYTRWFKVDFNTFIHGVETALGKRFAPSGVATQMDHVTSRKARLSPDKQILDVHEEHSLARVVPQPASIIDGMREFFAAAGVDLAPPKAVFFNDRLGMLMVRAALDDFGAIEKAVQAANTAPRQLTIEIRIAEIPKSDRVALGLNFPVNAATGTVKSAILSDPELVRDVLAAQNPLGILSEAQSHILIRALEQRPGVDLLTAPRITTLSGRHAQIKVTDTKQIVTGLTNTTPAARNPTLQPVVTPRELGPSIDVLPAVTTDGYSLDLTVSGTMTEFLGYQRDPKVLEVLIDGKPQSVETPQPRFRVSQAAGNARVPDGHTLVMNFGAISDDDAASGLKVAKERIAFITPIMIDPAGNRIHSEEDILRRNAPPTRNPGQQAQ